MDQLRQDLELLCKLIPFDAYIVGAGTQLDNGSVDIARTVLREKVSKEFVTGYKAVAAYDVAAQLFAAMPRVVQTISVSEYRQLGDDSEEPADAGGDNHKAGAGKTQAIKIADYLAGQKIKHLLVAGINSSFGLCWVTFYRKKNDTPFDGREAEIAKYSVPAILHSWQSRALQRTGAAERTGLIRLSMRELQIALMSVRGMRARTIADKLHLSTPTIETYLKDIRGRLGVEGRLTERHLEYPNTRRA